MEVQSHTSKAADLLTTEELAVMLRTSSTAILTMRHRGELPAALGFRRGRRVLYRRSDIDKWVQGEVEKQAPTP
jgi:excisionase family DNA binding protein